MDGYRLVSCYCRTKHEGGGVCVLLQNEILYKERNDITNLSIELVIEICAIEIPKLNLLIIVLYWPVKNRESVLFYDSLSKLLQLLSKKDNRKNIIIGGDFNVNILEHNNSSVNLLNLMKSFNFIQHIKEPTRVTQTTATCLDLIFSNIHNPNIKLHTLNKEYGLSDHKGILVTLQNVLTENNVKWYTKKRTFNSQNINKFKLELQNIDWNKVINMDKNTNNNFDFFHKILLNKLDITIPQKHYKIKNKKKNIWLTKGIKISCKNKRLLKLLISQTDNITLLNYYKKYEKQLKILVSASKKILYKNKIKKSDNITKTMWHIIKERTNKNTILAKNNLKININNVSTEDPHKIANFFNNYFTSGGTSTTTSGTVSQAAGRPIISPTNNSIFIRPTDQTEISNIIRKLKSKRSSGFDEMPPILIKECAEELSLPLSILINQSFSEGVVPDLLKISIVKPIYKKDKHCEVNNYRPITLLSTFSKIFESVMYNRVYDFCEKYDILNNNQHGFRKGRSTGLAVFKYIYEILNIINNKDHAVGILLDMTKAYDKVSFKILLNKLFGIGVRGTAHKWFISYFKNRIQYVDIKYHNFETGLISNIRSEPTFLNQSIPQGSVLGCLMFLLYINDLPNELDIPSIIFADDISLILPCSNNTQLAPLLNSNLTKVSDWLTDHNLEINFKKTKLIQFKPYQKKPLKIEYYFKNIKLESTNSHCLLGINIDTHLNWKDHINKISSKLSSFTYALTELKKTTDLQTATCAYYAYANSWLRYGIVLWGNSTNVSKIFVLQKKCIRILANIDQMTSCRSYFKSLEILTLTSLYIIELCTLVRNNKNLFPKYTRPTNLRPINKLASSTSKLSLVNTGPYAMSIKIYNTLPEHIRNINKNNTFKRTLKKYLIEKCYYSLQEFYSDNK